MTNSGQRLELIDGAADTLAALEATTTVEAESDSGSPSRGSVFAWISAAVLAAGLFVAAVSTTGNDSARVGNIMAWLSAGAALGVAVLAVRLAFKASKARDGYAAALASGFGIAGGLVMLSALETTSLFTAGTESSPSLPLIGAVAAATLGIVLAGTPASGRVLGLLVRYVWLPVGLIAVPVAAAVVMAAAHIVPAQTRMRGVELAVGGLGVIVGVWMLARSLQRERDADVAQVAGRFGLMCHVLASLAVVFGATIGLAGSLTSLLLIAGGAAMIVVVLREYAGGRRVRAAMEAIFEWAPRDDVADHLREAAEELVEALGDDTYVHSPRMIDYTIGIGRELDLPPGRLRVLGLGAMFHDVGTESIPDEILNKPGTLTDAERSLVEAHSERGYAMAARVHLLWEAAHAIRHHHEWVDGSGYPDGLAGDEIPIEARVIAVADMYDALTTPRPYREALTSPEALVMMKAEVGSHLDARCYEAFVRCLRTDDDVVVPLRGAGPAT